MVYYMCYCIMVYYTGTIASIYMIPSMAPITLACKGSSMFIPFFIWVKFLSATIANNNITYTSINSFIPCSLINNCFIPCSTILYPYCCAILLWLIIWRWARRSRIITTRRCVSFIGIRCSIILWRTACIVLTAWCWIVFTRSRITINELPHLIRSSDVVSLWCTLRIQRRVLP